MQTDAPRSHLSLPQRVVCGAAESCILSDGYTVMPSSLPRLTTSRSWSVPRSSRADSTMRMIRQSMNESHSVCWSVTTRPTLVWWKYTSE
jgi:hypothetical protein